MSTLKLLVQELKEVFRQER